jgi:hypothetical protein
MNFTNDNRSCEPGGTRSTWQHHHTTSRLILGIQNHLKKLVTTFISFSVVHVR